MYAASTTNSHLNTVVISAASSGWFCEKLRMVSINALIVIPLVKKAQTLLSGRLCGNAVVLTATPFESEEAFEPYSLEGYLEPYHFSYTFYFQELFSPTMLLNTFSSSVVSFESAM